MIAKLVDPAALELPAASVTVALTVIVPSVKVVKSALVRVTACDAPVPVRYFVRVREPLVKEILSEAPFSALIVTTPLD